MSTEHVETRTYGHWGQIRTPGILGMGLIGTLVLFGGLIVSIGVLMVSNFLYAIAVFTPVAVLLFVTSRKDRHGRSLATKAVQAGQHWGARRAGRTRYRSGPAGAVPTGRNQLPGLAAASELKEAHDSYNRPFGVIHHPHPGHVVIGFAVTPEGGSLVDEHQVNQWVAGLDSFLRSLASEPDVMACQIVAESAPDSGIKLRRNVAAQLDPNTHPTARAVLDEIVFSYPSGAASLKAYVTITFTVCTVTGHRRDVDDVVRDLAARIPGFVGRLSITGAGTIRPLSAQEWCEVIRVAYDPAAATAIEAAYAERQTPALSWADVGPVAHENDWASYRHDSAVSVTWQMTGAPTGFVRANVFETMLAPHPKIARKRVTLLYRPIDASVQNQVAEADRRTYGFLGGRAAQDAVSIANAQRREVDVANGAGLVNFGMLITATVQNVADLPDATTAVDGLTGSARIQTRVATAMQDTAFAAALPIGLILPVHRASGPATTRRKG